MSHPIAYAAMWLALAVLMLVLNFKSGWYWVAWVSLIGLIASLTMCVLTLLGIVAVPS